MDRIAVIDAESARFAQVLAATDLSAPVPTCPDWSAADLLWHLTEVHLFWTGILAGGVRTDDGVAAVEEAKPARPDDLAGLLALRADATDRLIGELQRLDDTEPRWTWWDPEQTVGFTRRMQCYEAMMHRVDAERTAGVPVTPLAVAVATGAIDHAVDVMWAWQPDWARFEPAAVVELVVRDTGDRLLVELGPLRGTAPESGRALDWHRGVRTSVGEPSVTVTGDAADLALWAWGRGGDVEITGDAAGRAVLDRQLAQGM